MLDGEEEGVGEGEDGGEGLFHADMAGVRCPYYAGGGKRKRVITAKASADSCAPEAAGADTLHKGGGVSDGVDAVAAHPVEIAPTQGNQSCAYCGELVFQSDEVNRVKRYLKLARVNINSRQVYPCKNSPQGTDEHDQTTEF